jgi:chaperone BCS1
LGRFQVKNLKRIARFIPFFGRNLFLEHGRLFQFSRVRDEGGEERSVLSTIGRSTQPIKDLINNIVESESENMLQYTSIYMPRPNPQRQWVSPWKLVIQKRSRLLDTVVLEEEEMNKLVSELNEFLSLKIAQWYRERGVP